MVALAVYPAVLTYFFEAIRLLYPQYCRKLEHPVPTSIGKER